jgi:hypothetical protein
MVYLHEVWLHGQSEPQRLSLEDDELFKAFQRWIEKDVEFKANGHVCTINEKNVRKTVALNFSRITCMMVEKIEEATPRPALGFSSPPV